MKRLFIFIALILNLMIVNLAISSEISEGVEAYGRGDYATALKELKPFAEQGNAEAQFFFGQMYRRGLGVKGNEKTGMYWIGLAANQGLAEAQYNMGFSYHFGFDIFQNFSLAIEWYQRAAEQGHSGAKKYLEDLSFLIEKDEPVLDETEKAAAAEFEKARVAGQKGESETALRILNGLVEQGNADAQLELGVTYLKGWGVTRDVNFGLELLVRAAKQGNVQALFTLGSTFHIGRKVQKDLETAAIFYKLAAAQGDEVSTYRLGMLYSEWEDNPNHYVEARKWFKIEAERGSSNAQRKMADIYFEGLGVARDFTVAARWTRLAAEQGDAISQVTLGDMYKEGLGITKDLTAAARWYRHAVNRSYPGADKRLAQIEAKLKKETPAKDTSKNSFEGRDQNWFYREYYKAQESFESGFKYSAIDIWKGLAEQGDAKSQYRLGMLYKQELRGEQISLEWIRLSVEQSYPWAQYEIGKRYQVGEGVAEDEEVAMKWLKLAADQGHERAASDVISAYLMGWGAKKDEAEANRLVRYYAERGIADLQYQLGFMYEKGNYLSKDFDMAVQWYQRAADQGNIFAIERLAELKVAGNGADKGATNILLEDKTTPSKTKQP